jgi:hypothetical protein
MGNGEVTAPSPVARCDVMGGGVRAWLHRRPCNDAVAFVEGETVTRKVQEAFRSVTGDAMLAASIRSL